MREAGEEGGAFGVEAGGEPVAQENIEAVAGGVAGAGEGAAEGAGVRVDDMRVAREPHGVARREGDAEPAGRFVEDFAGGGEGDQLGARDDLGIPDATAEGGGGHGGLRRGRRIFLGHEVVRGVGLGLVVGLGWRRGND